MKYFVHILILVIGVNNLNAQDFLNNDLDGIVLGSSVLPVNWQNVPHTDINCQAVGAYGAIPDLTDMFGPAASNGIVGNPYSGNTFVSGLFG